MIICFTPLDGMGCRQESDDDARHCRHCGRSLQQAVRLLNRGARVRHYRVVKAVGYGGFGAVYEAQDEAKGNREVALKETFNPTSIEQFRQEYHVLRQRTHRLLPTYHEIFEERGKGYLVMEFVAGQSLVEMLTMSRAPLSEAQVLRYVSQLCEILHHLHSQTPSLLHRDIKPSNIRVTPTGDIKLVDFGLAKESNTPVMTKRLGWGTPTYMPLEQATGGQLDARTDLYAVGATMYHLLTNHLPTPGRDRGLSGSDPLLPPTHYNPRLSSETVAIIRKAMERDPHQRYPHALAMKEAADKALLVMDSPPPYASSQLVTRAWPKVLTQMQALQQQLWDWGRQLDLPTLRLRPDPQRVTTLLHQASGVGQQAARQGHRLVEGGLEGFVVGLLAGALGGGFGGAGSFLLDALVRGQLRSLLTLWLEQPTNEATTRGIYDFLIGVGGTWVVGAILNGALLGALVGLLLGGYVTVRGHAITGTLVGRGMGALVGGLWGMIVGGWFGVAHRLIALVVRATVGAFIPTLNSAIPSFAGRWEVDLAQWALFGILGWALFGALDMAMGRVATEPLRSGSKLQAALCGAGIGALCLMIGAILLTLLWQFYGSFSVELIVEQTLRGTLFDLLDDMVVQGWVGAVGGAVMGVLARLLRPHPPATP